MLADVQSYLIFVIFYTIAIWGKEILHLKVCKFATKVVSPQTGCKILQQFFHVPIGTFYTLKLISCLHNQGLWQIWGVCAVRACLQERLKHTVLFWGSVDGSSESSFFCHGTVNYKSAGVFLNFHTLCHWQHPGTIGLFNFLPTGQLPQLGQLQKHIWEGLRCSRK